MKDGIDSAGNPDKKKSIPRNENFRKIVRASAILSIAILHEHRKVFINYVLTVKSHKLFENEANIFFKKHLNCINKGLILV